MYDILQTIVNHAQMSRRLLFILTLSSCLHLQSIEGRVFTNSEGVTIEADLHSIDGSLVTIRRHSDKSLYKLELKSFSEKDQKFIKAEQKAGRLTIYKYTTPADSFEPARVLKKKKHFNASARIDQILDQYWQSKGVQPRPFVDDSTFLRRTYLKIIGRIPTHAEAVHFLNDESPYKRTTLIDKLLDSPGYVSHQFNLWADVLRVRTTGREGGYYGGLFYAPWLKEQIRQNVPYDVFVKSLLTAHGYPWENPASAYYLRDFGMPLDNMSMTAQIFLGTQLQCAQCHDHPTDVWTQKEFFELSAFTYGLRTGMNPQKEVEDISQLMKYLRENDLIKKDDRNGAGIGRFANDFFQPMRYGVVNSNRKLRLPHDYQYDDAKPKSEVQPAVLYGESEEVDLHDPDQRVGSYADWMVSSNNQRFTKVIANRMWKHAMGKGLIEPVDNLMASTVADVPALMTYLEELMVSLDYDLKQYLRIIYNTRYFQREAVIDNPDLEDDYHLEGPLFQRMSAEQIWDSMATLMTPDLDSMIRETYSGRTNRTKYDSTSQPVAYTYLQELSTEQLADYILEAAAVNRKFEEARAAYYAIRNEPELKNTDQYKETKQEFERLRTEADKVMNPNMVAQDSSEMSMMMSSNNPPPKRRNDSYDFPRHIRRASELNSPAHNGHLLQIFGQSDRDLIENSESTSNVIQALFLMNSEQINVMMAKRSTPVLEARLAKTPEEKLETLYIGFLSRKPTAAETEALLPYFIENPEEARASIIWAMMNTQQFIFIQ